jgi:hypothetical protein
LPAPAVADAEAVAEPPGGQSDEGKGKGKRSARTPVSHGIACRSVLLFCCCCLCAFPSGNLSRKPVAAKGKAAPKNRFKAGLIRGTASAGGVVEDPIRDFSQTPAGVGDGDVTPPFLARGSVPARDGDDELYPMLRSPPVIHVGDDSRALRKLGIPLGTELICSDLRDFVSNLAWNQDRTPEFVSVVLSHLQSWEVTVVLMSMHSSHVPCFAAFCPDAERASRHPGGHQAGHLSHFAVVVRWEGVLLEGRNLLRVRYCCRPFAPCGLLPGLGCELRAVSWHRGACRGTGGRCSCMLYIRTSLARWCMWFWAGPSPYGCMAAELQEGMQNMLRGAFGQNPVGKLESVDIGARMSELGLAQWLPDEARCMCVAVYVAGRVCIACGLCRLGQLGGPSEN